MNKRPESELLVLDHFGQPIDGYVEGVGVFHETLCFWTISGSHALRGETKKKESLFSTNKLKLAK